MNANRDERIESILKRQNPDGGWSYTRGPSWTEPTLYAARVLQAAGADATALARAVKWIGHRQRQDGGFAPCDAVDLSTWVTGLALLFSPTELAGGGYQKALGWVLRQTGQETNWMYRLRLRLNSQPDRFQVSGWPWIPGAASWVSPTSTALMGLRRAQHFSSDGAIAQRINEGRQYLMTHTCEDGGWNHGSERALGYSAQSYPETTGAALLALRGVPRAPIAGSLARAKLLASTCSFSEGLSWLRMGLAAHGESLAAKPGAGKPRNLRDQCLAVLASQMAAGTVEL